MGFLARLFGRPGGDDWQQPLFQAMFVSLIRNLPSHWKSAMLTLEAPPEGLGRGVAQSITSPEGHRDVVFPADDLLLATRKLELACKQRNMLWNRVTVTVKKDGENWKSEADFEYPD